MIEPYAGTRTSVVVTVAAGAVAQLAVGAVEIGPWDDAVEKELG
jgi:hypothetical protein